MINEFVNYPRYAVVSDSYDYWHVIDKIWGEKLKDK